MRADRFNISDGHLGVTRVVWWIVGGGHLAGGTVILLIDGWVAVSVLRRPTQPRATHFFEASGEVRGEVSKTKNPYRILSRSRILDRVQHVIATVRALIRTRGPE